jgi:hypothetical protein
MMAIQQTIGIVYDHFFVYLLNGIEQFAKDFLFVFLNFISFWYWPLTHFIWTVCWYEIGKVYLAKNTNQKWSTFFWMSFFPLYMIYIATTIFNWFIFSLTNAFRLIVPDFQKVLIYSQNRETLIIFLSFNLFGMMVYGFLLRKYVRYPFQIEKFFRNKWYFLIYFLFFIVIFFYVNQILKESNIFI